MENIVINGVTYSEVDSIALTNENSEQVQYYSDAVRYNAQTLTDEQKVQARMNIDAAYKSTVFCTTLTVAGWLDNGDGRYSQTITVSNVTTDSPIILVDVALTGTDLEADAETLGAWCPEDGTGASSQNVVQGNGTLTFYCTAIPSVDIPINVGVL